MKNEKRRSAFLHKLSIILVVLFVFASSEAGEKLKIEIWTDKAEFLTHEPIVVHYTVTNIGDSMAYLNFQMIEEDFVIEDENGNRYRSHIRGTYVGGQLFAPGETYTDNLDIGGCYGVNGVGDYTCYVHSYPFFYSNAEFLNSNTIEFKVIKPKGEEEKALHLFLEAEKLEWARSEAGGPDLSKEELAFLKYQELADKYPQSVYAPKALYAAVGVYFYSRDLKQRRLVIPVCLRLIQEYPESYLFQLAFTQLLHTYEMVKDKEDAVKTLKELIRKHPDTKISEEAQRRLRQVDDWGF
jgi:tetratricopeptide (TPR) repeat protein